MTQDTTTRLGLIKNQDDEFVDIDEINAAFQAIDDWLIPSCKLERTAGAGNQSIANNTTVQVDFNQARWDTWNGKPEGAMADAANNTIICRIAGLYAVVGTCAFASNATGIRAIIVRLNGSPYMRYHQDANASASTPLFITAQIPLNANDTVDLAVVQGSGAALNLDPTLPGATDNCALSATWIGKKP